MKGGRPEHITGDVVEDGESFVTIFTGVGWTVRRTSDGARLLPGGRGWSTDVQNEAWFSSRSAAWSAAMAQAIREETVANGTAGR